MYAFGSRGMEALRAVKNNAYQMPASASDLDIGVLTQSPLSVEKKVELGLALEDIFGVQRVDLSVLQEVDAFLAVNIIRGERLYAKDDYLADEYELFVLRRAGDLAEFERQRIAMILQEK